jgi:hypothetical protein
MAPAITATRVISSPLNHQGRVVTRLLAMPTAKWARILSPAAHRTAGVPRVKRKGKTGMIPPMAVEAVADRHAVQGFGKVVSDRPSSSCTRVWRNCSGRSRMRATRVRASSAVKPFSW